MRCVGFSCLGLCGGLFLLFVFVVVFAVLSRLFVSLISCLRCCWVWLFDFVVRLVDVVLLFRVFCGWFGLSFGFCFEFVLVVICGCWLFSVNVVAVGFLIV